MTTSDIELAASELTLDESTELVRETEQRKDIAQMNANDKKPDRPDSQPTKPEPPQPPDHPGGPPVKPTGDIDNPGKGTPPPSPPPGG